MCTQLIEQIRTGNYSQTMTWKVCDALPFAGPRFPRVASALGGDIAAAHSLRADAEGCDAEILALADAIVDRARAIQVSKQLVPA